MFSALVSMSGSPVLGPALQLRPGRHRAQVRMRTRFGIRHCPHQERKLKEDARHNTSDPLQRPLPQSGWADRAPLPRRQLTESEKSRYCRRAEGRAIAWPAVIAIASVTAAGVSSSIANRMNVL